MKWVNDLKLMKLGGEYLIELRDGGYYAVRCEYRSVNYSISGIPIYILRTFDEGRKFELDDVKWFVVIE